MSAQSTILYPKLGDGQFFNMEYYVKEHMPKVQNAWGPHGLKSWQVLKFAPSPDGSPAPYHAGVTIIWESAEALKAALSAPEAKAVIADKPNFTDVDPILLNASVESSSA